MKLIALGDNVIDYYHNTQECFPGGNAVNVAVHAARLGAQAEYLGSLGDDKMAHIVEKALRENGVDISHCPVLPGRTTKVCSYDVVNGERSFIEVITGESWTGPLQIGARELDEL
ncbi:PfkB family carbohydrate kinase, partial [Gemmiger sp.]